MITRKKILCQQKLEEMTLAGVAVKSLIVNVIWILIRKLKCTERNSTKFHQEAL